MWTMGTRGSTTRPWCIKIYVMCVTPTCIKVCLLRGIKMHATNKFGMLLLWDGTLIIIKFTGKVLYCCCIIHDTFPYSCTCVLTLLQNKQEQK
jgi:hypothetical protein